MILPYYLALNLTYWIACLICLRRDDWETTKKAFPRTFINITVLSIPLIIALSYLVSDRAFELERCIIHLAIMFLSVDFWMYITHYAFHHRYLYKYHKIHHEFTHPVGMVALYTHWSDLYFNNVLPVVATGLLLRSDYITMIIWIIITTFNAVFVSHSGATNDKYHLIHHRLVVYNYGICMYMDKILGTYKDIDKDVSLMIDKNNEKLIL